MTLLSQDDRAIDTILGKHFGIKEPCRVIAAEAERRVLLEHRAFLNWLADRLVDVYGESANVDFVLKLREIAKL